MEKKSMKGYLYLMPALIVILLFTIYPLIRAFIMSFMEDYNMINGTYASVGFSNYVSIFKDKYFIKALTNTGIYVAFVVPCSIALSLLIAVLLNSKIKFQGFFQTLYFLPYVTSVIAIGIVAMVVSGVKGHIFNYSLDFIGGASTSVTFNENYSVEKLESDVQPVVSEVTGDNDIQMTPVTGSNEVIIKTRTLTVDERDALYSKLSETFGVDESTIQTENISAAVSSEMKRSAILSVIIAAIFMLIYVWIRFKEFSFGASSVLPLLHDVFVLLAFYAVLRWTVGNTFIACMLTLVGYSINATIVVFDRIRENLHTNKNLAEVVNVSVTQTLSRSINTSLTTLIMVVVLYILGVTSIKEFALPLIVGVICGCYSSVCIAGCLWYDLKNALDKRKAKKASK